MTLLWSLSHRGSSRPSRLYPSMWLKRVRKKSLLRRSELKYLRENYRLRIESRRDG